MEVPYLLSISNYTLKTKKPVVFAMIVFFSLLGTAYSMDVTLQWNANSERDIVGYRIHYDIDSGYPYDGFGAQEGASPIDVTLCDNESADPDAVEYTLHGLPDEVYYFAVTAYDGETPPFESGYSNEISINDSSDSDEGENITTGSGSGGGGCFISTLMQ